MSLITQIPYKKHDFSALNGYGSISRNTTGNSKLLFQSSNDSDFATYSSGIITFSKSGKYLIEMIADFQISSNLNSTGTSSSKFSIKKNSTDLCYYGGNFNYSPVTTTIISSNFTYSDYWLDTSARSTLPSGTISGAGYSVDKKFSYSSEVYFSISDTLSLNLDLQIASPNTTVITYRNMTLSIKEMAN